MPPTDAPEKFIPLGNTARPTGPERHVFRPKVLPGVDSVPAFKPLTPASAPHVHLATATASAPPVVTLKREGDLVTGIRIHCACGQVIELACSY